MKKFASVLTDKRLAHYTPFNFLRRMRMKREIKPVDVKEILVSVTFDVEYRKDKGNFFPVDEFFNKKIGKKSTLFVQGNLVKKYSSEIKKTRGEIGLHGYAHELWGPEKWWRPDPFVNFEERERLLQMCINSFKECKIKKPISFRAPYLISDDKTFNLLKKYGFLIDSSLPSYLGIYPIPKKIDGIISIPVSVNPLPKFSIKNLMPYTYYDVLTMETMCRFSNEEFIEFVNTVFFFQKKFSIKPNLVFLSHPWEFVKQKKNGYEYCSTANFDIIDKLCSILNENYKIKYLTMSELGKIL